jgi:hypothetical protein
MPLSVQMSAVSIADDICDAMLSLDASGHEHKGKGKRGGQFVAKHTENGTSDDTRLAVPERHASGLATLTEIGKSAIGKTLDLEHGAKELVKAQFEKLPDKVRAPVAGFLKLFYGTYVVAQKAVDEVAKEQGISEEGRHRLASVVCAIDAAGMKANMIAGAAAAGPIGSTVASFVPVGSLSYLAFSAVKNPMAVLRGAKAAVADYAASLKKDADTFVGKKEAKLSILYPLKF